MEFSLTPYEGSLLKTMPRKEVLAYPCLYISMIVLLCALIVLSLVIVLIQADTSTRVGRIGGPGYHNMLVIVIVVVIVIVFVIVILKSDYQLCGLG